MPTSRPVFCMVLTFEKNSGLKVYVPGWDNLPPPNTTETITVQLDSGTGRFDTVAEHEFTMETGGFPEDFPYEMLIDINRLPDVATCQLRYIHRSYTGFETYSQVTTVLCDRVRPNNDTIPGAPVFTGNFLDDTNLPAGGKLTVTIPGYPDWQATDQLAVYLIDSWDIPDDPTATTPIWTGFAPAPGVTNSTVEIDADDIRAFGDTKALITYAMRDKALNESWPARYKQVSLTFGPLPDNLEKPTVPDAIPGPLTMEHVSDGVSVWIDKYDNFKGGDYIRLKWGGETLEDFPIGNNQEPSIEIPVLPALLMLTDYGQATTGDKNTLVSYEVIRAGRPFGPASDTFNVNFETVLPWLPWPPVDWPDPVHPDLLAGDVKNFDGTRTNELTRADKGEDAKFHFTWYDAAVNGHIVDFYWNGARVVEAQVIFDDTETGHVPGDPFVVDIPWEYIKNGGNGNPVPVHYQLSGANLVNDLHSETTEVLVNAIAVELPAASFPSFAEQPSPDYPGCGALETNGSLRVAIPDLTGVLEEGDEINVVFTPMRGDDLSAAEDPITAAIFTKIITLDAANFPVTGFTLLVQPYDTHILPLYDENAASNRRGRVKIQYFFDDGSENIGSTALIARTAFHGPNDSCPITPNP